MTTFQTRFSLQGVPTDVRVRSKDNKTFEIALNLVDFYEGGELPVADKEKDAVIRMSEQGRWEVLGESRILLDEADLANLGQAIERDYLYRQED